MEPLNYPDIQSIRLASGIEMQQKWPVQIEQEERQKSNESPRLIELSPSEGPQGTALTVVVQSLPELIAVKLAFSTLVVDTERMQSQGVTTLVATVPPFQCINATSQNVTISICTLENDTVITTCPIAEFRYIQKITPTASTSNIPPTSNLSAPLIGLTEEENFLGVNTTFNGYYPTFQFNTQPLSYNCNTSSLSQYHNQNNDINTNVNTSLNTLNYDADLLNNTHGYSQMLNEPFDHTVNHFPPIQYNVPTHNSQKSYYYPKPNIPATSVANYQPYPGLVSRSNLKIIGDLDSMTKNWSAQEYAQNRRLVQFWREKDGADIQCTFGPHQSEQGIIVSCIYWAERDDYYITSVDCIHLLESLMDNQFRVEEKNRVRRNLEGFRPLTASKSKPESTDFFKLIMGFPHPKPRNIEKDIKVFPWKVLPYALKKIITKYTASAYRPNPSLKSNAYSSTESLLK